MQVKEAHKGEGATEVNFKHGGGQKNFACSARELIPCSPTFKSINQSISLYFTQKHIEQQTTKKMQTQETGQNRHTGEYKYRPTVVYFFRSS